MIVRTDEDWAALHELYVTRELSLQDLAEMIYEHRTSISRQFKRRGLPVRRQGRRAA